LWCSTLTDVNNNLVEDNWTYCNGHLCQNIEDATDAEDIILDTYTEKEIDVTGKSLIQTESTWYHLVWLGLDWACLSSLGLVLSALVWLGLAWTGLGWLGLAWTGLVWLGLEWASLGLIGLAWAGLDWLGLAWA
jgi:hypothetical protein